jgi:Cu(I)/Ag(I) efflux system membrane fusion protein
VAAVGSEEREALYWYDPMYPGTRFDKPGKSPFMDMDLVPRYKDEEEGEGILIDPAMTQNLGLTTVKAVKGRLSFSGEYPADVEFNGYQTARLQPRAGGFVSSVRNIYPGDAVKEGDLIVEITVPAWAGDQSDYLLLKKQNAEPRIIRGVREKLRLSGMPEEMLDEIDRSGKIQTALKITAPVSGVLTELNVFSGMNVEKEMTLAVIQGMDPAWVTVYVPQRDLFLINGKPRLTLSGYPGRVFPLENPRILQKVDTANRAVPVRFTAPNPQGRLIPGLSARVGLRAQGDEGVVIPTQTIIDLGDEKRVVIRTPEGRFLPRKVTVGASSRGRSVVLEGVNEGDELVENGLFLIDSEANFRGAFARMEARAGEAPETDSPETSALGAEPKGDDPQGSVSHAFHSHGAAPANEASGGAADKEGGEPL